MSRAAVEKAFGDLMAMGIQNNPVAPAELARMRQIAKPVAGRALASDGPAIQTLYASEVERLRGLQ